MLCTEQFAVLSLAAAAATAALSILEELPSAEGSCRCTWLGTFQLAAVQKHIHLTGYCG